VLVKLRFVRLAAALALSGSFVAVATASPALADYGKASTYQVEISANMPANFAGPGTGGGIWLWIQLGGGLTSGTGDYQGSDCLHGATNPIGPQGTFADHGTVSWSSDGTTVTIQGVIIGGVIPVTVTVPAHYGHLTTDMPSVFPGIAPPGFGTANVQVAP